MTEVPATPAEVPKTLEPLIIDPRYIRALPKALFRSNCVECDRLQAMWEMGPEGGERVFICSICFLYESNWGQKRIEQVHDVVQEVEKESGSNFMRDADGDRLLSSKDADGIVGALALTSRMFFAQDRMQAMAGDPEEVSAEGAEVPQEAAPDAAPEDDGSDSRA